jgi:hypothetical protein
LTIPKKINGSKRNFPGAAEAEVYCFFSSISASEIYLDECNQHNKIYLRSLILTHFHTSLSNLWRDPEGSSNLMLPDLKTIGT